MLDLAAISKHQARVNPRRDPATVRWLVIGGRRGRLAQRSGACAWYSAWHDAICVPEYLVLMVSEPMYAPTITHELTHAAQRRDMGLPSYLLTKLLARPLLEREAEREERRAQDILGVHVL